MYSSEDSPPKQINLLSQRSNLMFCGYYEWQQKVAQNEGFNCVRSRYVITRNSIQAEHKNKRQLAFEENRLRYDLQQLVKENAKDKHSIGKHRVSLTVKLASVLWKANKVDDAENCFDRC